MMTEKYTVKKWYDESGIYDDGELFAIVDVRMQADKIARRLNEQAEAIKGYKELLYYDSEDTFEIKLINSIYNREGFKGVIDYATGKLSEYGAVREVDKGLWVMVTGGWSDNEHWIHCLNNMVCLFGMKHYCGYVRGGAFYYSEDTDRSVEITFEKGE